VRKLFVIGLYIVFFGCFVSTVTADCSVVGQWTRSGGIQGTWNYFANGSATYGDEPGFPGFVGTARWVSNGGGSFTTSWNHGYDDLLRWNGNPNPPDYPNYIDYITIGGDCNTFTGKNKFGESFGGVRSIPPAPIATVSTPQYQSPDLVSTTSTPQPQVTDTVSSPPIPQPAQTGNWVFDWFTILRPVLDPVRRIIPIPTMPMNPVPPIPTIPGIPYTPAPIPSIQPIPTAPGIPYNPAPIPRVPVVPIQPIHVPMNPGMP
jgi:hypothetical protein